MVIYDLVRLRTCTVVLAWATGCCTGGLPTAAAVLYETVLVGDAGNAADSTGYGAVDYDFRIGKYEVTVGQYTEFLNAVAANDLHGLYSEDMATRLNTAGIAREGEAGSYVYSVMMNGGDSSNRPITSVSWRDAARFANWMHNGQGSGSTETGAYEIGDPAAGIAPLRNPGARFWIPTENEWYKAAYFKGGEVRAGYWDYATQSNQPPGNIVGVGLNQANYFAGATWPSFTNGRYAVTQSVEYSASQNYLTDVGAFASSESAYGAFDMSGNVYEWYDPSGPSEGHRSFRGGAFWVEFPALLSRTHKPHSYSPFEDVSYTGFRLASPVPEPSPYAMALSGLAVGGWQMFWRRWARA